MIIVAVQDLKVTIKIDITTGITLNIMNRNEIERDFIIAIEEHFNESWKVISDLSDEIFNKVLADICREFRDKWNNIINN